MRAKIKGARAAAIAARYKAGVNLHQISIAENIYPSTVAAVLRREGVTLRKPGRNTAAIERVVCEAMLRQYNEGISTREIAKLHDISKTSVIRAIIRLGGTLRPEGRPETTGEWRKRGRGKWSKTSETQSSPSAAQR